MPKKRKIEISPLVPKAAVPIKLVYQRPPANYNPLVIIDDIVFEESDKPL
jgi:hypothetical protein